MRDLVPLSNELDQPTYNVDLLDSINSSRAEENGLWSLGEALGTDLGIRSSYFVWQIWQRRHP